MSTNIDQEYLNLSQIYRALQRHKSVMVLLPSVFLLLGWLWVAYATHLEWVATANIEIGRAGSTSPIETPAEISSRILSPRFSQAISPNMNGLAAADVAALLRSSLVITNDSDVKWVQLSVRGASAEVAERLLSNVADRLVKEHQLLSTKKTQPIKEKINFYNKELKKINDDANSIRRELGKTRQDAALIWAVASLGSYSSAQRDLQEKLTSLQSQLEEPNLTETRQQGDISLSSNEVGPKKKLVLLIALMLGLVVSGLIAIIRGEA